MAVSEAGRVLGLGRSVPLGNLEVTLKFDLEAMAELEDLYGEDALRKFADDMDSSRFRAIWRGMTAALAHRGGTRAAREALVRANSQQVQADRLTYITALAEAFIEALPTPEGSDDSGKDQGVTDGSPGLPTTGPSPSDSGAPMPSSAE